MRLVDADKFEAFVIRTNGDEEFVNGVQYVLEKIDKAPTVEAIPKAEVKKFLEEGTKNVSNNVLAIVREDYIHKADYETRLKADLEAILVELQMEIEEMKSYESPDGQDLVMLADIGILFQQKINQLKGEENEKSN